MNLSKATNKFMLFLLIYMTFFPILFMIIFISVLGIDYSEINAPVMNIVLTANMFLIPSVFFCLVTGKSPREIIPVKPIDMVDIILIVIMSLMLMIYSSMFGSIANIFTSNTVGEEISSETLEYSFAVMALSVGIAPPILEEIVFRGVILSGYKKAGAKTAIFLSGLFFGIMHLNFYQFFYAFPLGIALAVFVYYSGSILSSMLSHFVINFSQIALAYYIQTLDMPDEIEQLAQEAPTLAEKISVFLATIPICTIITPFFILALSCFIKRHKTTMPYSENGYSYKGYNTFEEKEKVVDIPFVLIFVFYIAVIVIEEVFFNNKA